MGDRHEQTFVLLKPDAVQRGIIGEIITRFEQSGYKLIALKLTTATQEKLRQLYSNLSDKPFFNNLISFTSTGPLVAMVWEGLTVVKTVRALLGETNPADSAPGTIRGDLCIEMSRNLIHASDSIENANREIKLWFEERECVLWKPAHEAWVNEC